MEGEEVDVVKEVDAVKERRVPKLDATDAATSEVSGWFVYCFNYLF